MRKVCCKCGIEKDLERFTKDKRRSDSRGSNCKKCHNKITKLSRCNKPGYWRSWRDNNPEKWRARSVVSHAVRDGRLKKKPCYCGETKVEGHHKDYSKPLDIEWLCKKHHLEKHEKETTDEN